MDTKFLTVTNYALAENSDLYMTFNITGKTYALPAEQIYEVVQLPALYLPEKAPDYVVGLLNLRGHIISVIDLCKFLGIPPKMYSTEHQVLIINSHGRTFGIIVDSVDNVIQLNSTSFEPLPYKSEERFISGVYKDSEKLVALIDLNIIVNCIETFHSEEMLSNNVIPTSTPDLFPKDELSVEKFKKRAANLQKEIKVDTEKINFQENRFVSFSLHGEIFCISLKYVKVFCKLSSVTMTSIPCVPEFIVGLISLRGEFITIIDLKSFLQIPKSENTEKTKIIVVKASNLQVGLLVDEVFDIANIPAERIRHYNSTKFEKHAYSSGEVILPEGGVMSILDLEKLLGDERILVEDAV